MEQKHKRQLRIINKNNWIVRQWTGKIVNNKTMFRSNKIQYIKR